MLIYRIWNTVNGKSYVGMTSGSLLTRFRKHKACARKGVNRYLYDAMNYYGIDKFIVESLEECDDVSQLADCERKWIAHFGCMMPDGYNMTPGGEGGYTLASWTEEERAALYRQQGTSRLGQKRGAESKARMALAAQGRVISAGQRLKISETNKERGVLPPLTVLYGTDNPNFIDIPIDEVLLMIKNCHTMKSIAAHFKVTPPTIWAKLKAGTGKTFKQWRDEYGITGRFSQPKTN